MTTARDMITSSMKKIGALVKSETPAADEVSDALSSLNMMISSWSNESLLIYTRVRESFTLTSGVTAYTIGAAQTFNTVRPIFIVEAHVREPSSNIDSPLGVVPDEVYEGTIIDKDVLGLPRIINYDNGFPTGIIRVYPTPSIGYELHLTSEKELVQLEIDDVISLPPGWELAMVYNLAVMIAPEYGQQVTGEIAEVAKMSKANIQMTIAKNRTMDVQSVGRRNNFYSGYFN